MRFGWDDVPRYILEKKISQVATAELKHIYIGTQYTKSNLRWYLNALCILIHTQKKIQTEVVYYINNS